MQTQKSFGKIQAYYLYVSLCYSILYFVDLSLCQIPLENRTTILGAQSKIEM